MASESSWKKEIKDNENLPQTLRRLLHCSPNSGPADASSGPRSKKAFLSQAIPGFPLRIWGRAEPRWPSFFLRAQKEESFRNNADPLSGETGKKHSISPSGKLFGCPEGPLTVPSFPSFRGEALGGGFLERVSETPCLLCGQDGTERVTISWARRPAFFPW